MSVITREDLEELGVEGVQEDAQVEKLNEMLAERIGLAVAAELDDAGLEELKAAVAEGKDLMEFAKTKFANLDDIVRDETDIFLADLVGGEISVDKN